MLARIGNFLALATPMIVSRAGLAGMSIADGLMVARHSAGELAVLGLADGTIGRVIDVLAAFLAAGMVLAANAQAAGRLHEAGAAWRHAMLWAIALGLALPLAGIVFWRLLLGAGEPPGLIAAAFPVAVALGVAAPVALMALVSGMFLEAVGRPQIVAVAIVAANVANIGLNLLLIPTLGALGSAISTGIVRTLLAVGLFACVWTLRDHAALGLRRPGASQWRSLAQQRRLGYGAAATAAVMNALAMGVTLLAGRIGTVALAAVTAMFNALSAAMLVALGMADATAIRVAAANGRRAGTLASFALGAGVTLATLVVFAALVALEPAALAGLYAPNPPLAPALIALLPLGALLMVWDGAVCVAAAALRGLGDVTWPTLIQIGTGLGMLPLAWWLAIDLGGGAPGLIEAILIASVLRAALLAWRFAWRAGAVRAPFAPQLS